MARWGRRRTSAGRTESKRSSKQQLRARSLRSETLESRIALDGQGLVHIPVDPWQLDQAELASLSATQFQWHGQSVYARENEWIVKLSMAGSPSAQQVAQAQELLDQHSGDLQIVKHLQASGTFLVHSTQGMSVEQVGAALSDVPGLQYFEPNFVVMQQATVPNDPFYSNQWWLDLINAPAAWDVTTGSGSVVIGVVDSGVNYLHPDLAANMWINTVEIAGDGIDNDGNGYIDDIHGWDFADGNSDPMDVGGHGTPVAGIIAAVGNNGVGVSGVNWNAQIMALKVESDQGGGWANTVEALNYATMMRVDYGVNVRVTNHSYGTPFYSEAFLEAIESARDAGILVIASAGNFTLDNNIFPAYPSTYKVDNVIAVAATTINDQLASFSNYGSMSVHLAAPGSGVYTTATDGGYRNFGGTSAASPVVAGVAALLWDAAPYATYDQIRDALMNGVDVIPALQGQVISNGRVNAGNSLELLGLRIIEVTPDWGQTVDAPVTDFTVTFAEPIDGSLIAAADFTVNGIPADALQIDSQSITFSYIVSPVASQGVQQIQLEAGTVAALTSPAKTNLLLTTSFRYDAQPLAIVATSPLDAAVVDLPLESVTVTFSEPVDPASIDPSNLLLSQGQVIAAQLVDAQTVTYALAGLSAEGAWNWGFGAGTIRDTNGNPMAAHLFQSTLNIPLRELQFQHSFLPGGLVYESTANTGLISNSDEVDAFSLYLEDHETVSVQLSSTSPTAQMTIELAPLGITITGQPGETVVLPATAVAAGSYELLVSSSESVEYRLDVVRNAEVEWSDSSLDAPLTLEPSWSPADTLRYAALGDTSLSGVAYAADMSTDPGWNFTGQWQYGPASGLSGNPPSGYSGPNVIGYNLTGNYPNNMPMQTATTPAFSTLGQENLVLSFQRWLRVESATWDQASIRVSIDGANWINIWQHTGATITDTQWTQQTYALPAIVNNQPEVYLRWTLGPSDSSVNYAGWNIDDVVVATGIIDPGGISFSDTDLYLIDLSDSVGSTIDIVLAGETHNFAGQTLQLLASDQTTVLATAVASDAANLDLEIIGYTVTDAGPYYLRLDSALLGRYQLLVTESLAIEREPNDAAPGHQQLSSGVPIVGQIGVPELAGLHQLQIDAAASHVTLSAMMGQIGLPQVTATPQAPGSLSTSMQGTLQLQLGDQNVAITSGLIDPQPQAGIFVPSNSGADFAGHLSLLTLPVPFRIAGSQFDLHSETFPLGVDGAFSMSDLSLVFGAGDLFATLLGNAIDLSLNGFVLTGAEMSGVLEVLPGQLRLTAQVSGGIREWDPMLSMELKLDFAGTIVATAPLPIPDDDVYAVELTEGETYTLALDTLFSSPGASPTNNLVASFSVLDSEDTVIATSDENGQVTFVAPHTGDYRIVVVAESGLGDYLLRINTLDPAVPFELFGPASGIRGLQQAFSIVVGAEGEHSFAIDWNGDGTFDQVVAGSGVIHVQNTFAHRGDFNVRVAALGAQGQTGTPTEHEISIVPFAAWPDPARPGITHLIFGGSPGNDSYIFQRHGTDAIRVLSFVDNGVANTVATIVPGINGDVIAMGFGGDDLLWADLPAGTNAILMGGDGNDILVGGRGNDVILGDAGDDIIFGGGGFNLLAGGSGNNTIISVPGQDTVLGGQGGNSGLVPPLGDFFPLAGAAAPPRPAQSTISPALLRDLVFSEWMDELSPLAAHRKPRR